jgi:hypothetical protein
MKKLGQFCALAVLMLSIAATSYAGHIDCPGITDSSQATTSGEMPNDITDVLLVMLAII